MRSNVSTKIAAALYSDSIAHVHGSALRRRRGRCSVSATARVAAQLMSAHTHEFAHLACLVSDCAFTWHVALPLALAVSIEQQRHSHQPLCAVRYAIQRRASCSMLLLACSCMRCVAHVIACQSDVRCQSATAKACSGVLHLQHVPQTLASRAARCICGFMRIARCAHAREQHSAAVAAQQCMCCDVAVLPALM